MEIINEKEEKHEPDKPQHVIISRIDVSFLNLAELLVKLALAAVPAAILVVIFWTVVVRVILGIG